LLKTGAFSFRADELPGRFPEPPFRACRFRIGRSRFALAGVIVPG
jgi:hypothetical protein